MSESTELLIYFDEQKSKNQTETLESFIPFFETGISKFNELEIGLFKKENFAELFLNPKEFLFNQLMADKPRAVGGMKVSKEKLFDLLEKPTGYFTLISEIQSLQNQINPLSPRILYISNLEAFLQFFEFDSEDKIQLTKKIKEEIERKNKVYVSKESSKALFKLFTKLQAMFNESKEVIENTTATAPVYKIEGFIKNFLPFIPEDRKYKINIESIKWHDDHAEK